eukprot:4683524-Lingulodinium_polyedra.AAC.1
MLVLVSKAEQVILPVLAGGHWTRMVCRRKHAEAASFVWDSPPEERDAFSVGCPKCQGSGCLPCNLSKASQYNKRKDLGKELFQPSLWPELGAGSWAA